MGRDASSAIDMISIFVTPEMNIGDIDTLYCSALWSTYIFYYRDRPVYLKNLRHGIELYVISPFSLLLDSPGSIVVSGYVLLFGFWMRYTSLCCVLRYG